jgi:hypothetical protein
MMACEKANYPEKIREDVAYDSFETFSSPNG